MPKSFPRAPLPVVAALVSPLAWLYGRPDLFDTYSCGVLLMQMSGACALPPRRARSLAAGELSVPAALRLTLFCAACAAATVSVTEHTPASQRQPRGARGRRYEACAVGHAICW